MSLRITTHANGAVTSTCVVSDIAPVLVVGGETMRVGMDRAAVDRIELIDLTMPAAPNIDGATVQFPADAPGHCRFLVHGTDGSACELRTLTCEREALATAARGKPGYSPTTGIAELRISDDRDHPFRRSVITRFGPS